MRVLALVAALLLAGCATPDAPGGTNTPPPSQTDAYVAPWWNLGESWTIRFTAGDAPARTTALVNFANDTFGDPPHFWLGTSNRGEALDHVFFDTNPFLGRIHWILLAPHEKGMHSIMYEWPLRDGDTWGSPILFGKKDILVTATRQADGTMRIEGEARADGTRFEYDYDPSTRWFRHLQIGEGDILDAEVIEHKDNGAKGTFYFLRGRDYLDSDGGSTGQDDTFHVKDEGATSIAFLLDVTTSGPATLEFIDPNGNVAHREAIPLGGAADKIVEIKRAPVSGDWRLRYVGTIQGTVLVRGIIEYKATL